MHEQKSHSLYEQFNLALEKKFPQGFQSLSEAKLNITNFLYNNNFAKESLALVQQMVDSIQSGKKHGLEKVEWQSVIDSVMWWTREPREEDPNESRRQSLEKAVIKGLEQGQEKPNPQNIWVAIDNLSKNYGDKLSDSEIQYIKLLLLDKLLRICRYGDENNTETWDINFGEVLQDVSEGLVLQLDIESKTLSLTPLEAGKTKDTVLTMHLSPRESSFLKSRLHNSNLNADYEKSALYKRPQNETEKDILKYFLCPDGNTVWIHRFGGSGREALLRTEETTLPASEIKKKMFENGFVSRTVNRVDKTMSLTHHSPITQLAQFRQRYDNDTHIAFFVFPDDIDVESFGVNDLSEVSIMQFLTQSQENPTLQIGREYLKGIYSREENVFEENDNYLFK